MLQWKQEDICDCEGWYCAFVQPHSGSQIQKRKKRKRKRKREEEDEDEEEDDYRSLIKKIIIRFDARGGEAAENKKKKNTRFIMLHPFYRCFHYPSFWVFFVGFLTFFSSLQLDRHEGTNNKVVTKLWFSETWPNNIEWRGASDLASLHCVLRVTQNWAKIIWWIYYIIIL